MPDAIVCLTRGYERVCDYEPLIERNRAIYELINKRLIRQYPLILWHEGNIPADHQIYIAERNQNEILRFVDVSPAFQLPQGLEGAALEEHWSIGYRLMCRFHYYFIWQYTREFEYVMRIDEDCLLRSVGYNPFVFLERSGADFATACYVEESHRLTNETLPTFVENYWTKTYDGPIKSNFYNHLFPYTNLYVTRTAYWRQPEVHRFLAFIASQPNALRFRWGDLPILGIGLNLFTDAAKIARIPAIGYVHSSHKWEVYPRP